MLLHSESLNVIVKKNCILAPPMNIEKWKNELGNKYCLLFRAHYEISKVMEIKEDRFVFNVSDYPTLEDLMIVADVLISDYSSIFFDFSIMDKPMIHFTCDYDKYSQNRGMYFDIRQKLDGSECEDVIIAILKFDGDNIDKTVAFRKQYVNYFGSATKKSLDCIIDHIGG